MQNVQVLLQPTEMETQPEAIASRRLGSVDGKVLSDSSISTCASALWRARSNSTGKTSMLWVPNTTSTHGARLVISPRSFCARQPPTAICMPGPLGLRVGELAQVAVQLIGGVFPDRTRVDNHDVGDLCACGCGLVAGAFEQAGHALGVVNIHLTTERLDDVGGGAHARY